MATGVPAIDFPTLGAALVVVAGTQVALWKAMETTIAMTAEVEKLNADKLADRAYVKKQRKKLGRQLLTWGLLVNLVEGAFVLALWAIIAVGPEVLLQGLGPDSISKPLSRLETIVYIIMAGGWTVGYYFQGGAPYWSGVRQWRAAGKWLRRNELGI